MESLIIYLRTIRSLTDDECAVIKSYFEQRHFDEAAYLLRSGKVCKELFFIVSGILRLVAINDKGADVTHYFMSEGQFCTVLKSFNEESAADDGIQACCETVVLSIAKEKLYALYKRLPFMVDVISLVNQQRMLEKIHLKNAYSGEDAAGRYRVFLNEQGDIANRVPLNYIASYLNVTPQSLSRIRRNLK